MMINRRTAIKAAGTAFVSATLAGRAAAEAEWRTEETPTDGSLYDVAYAGGDASTDGNAYAVGQEGVILERTERGWEKVADGGVTGDGRNLLSVDVTDDGERLWFAGASGAIGEYDVATGNINDRGEPQDNTNNFKSIAVTGESGEANVYAADGSGSISYSFNNGRSGTYDSAAPGHSLYGIDSDGSDDVWAVGGGGSVWRYNGAWRRTNIGNLSLRDIEIEDESGYTVGESGRVFEYAAGSWNEDTTDTGQNLKGLALGSPNVAVGASGIAIVNDVPADTPGSMSELGL
ncbi:hypothetical protein BRD02_10575 [Halobacteriales archaeon QS_8_69_73]|nr:MAG: hypothetical protein BRD02_10575 [Halobacteriales archaeon QS_8_69_73]